MNILLREPFKKFVHSPPSIPQYLDFKIFCLLIVFSFIIRPIPPPTLADVRPSAKFVDNSLTLKTYLLKVYDIFNISVTRE